ncbi:MAG TPA: radical SAM family heme chaperone HemW, partial [Candidatus Aphodomorpha intestinavium]|nr:radical SAM family heme chaperone HemW [Candidatus Aphodomorpha intestinavium]
MAGVYFHIPFCVRKCAYCDFVSYAQPERAEGYAALLEREIALASKRLPVPAAVETVFFGGGTPSLLSGGALSGVLDALRARYPVAPDAEITVECNPGAVDAARLAAYRAAGVNRLSVGLQSADGALLAAIGRIHTYEQFERTMALARDAGFDNINVDVMHGLPGQSAAAYLDTLARVCARPDVRHVSAYALILEEGTPLFERVRAGRAALPDEDAVADMQDAGMAYLAAHGFTRYEISNFARAGFSCRHNLNYWNNGEYLGFGAAAHGAQRVDGVWTRRENHPALETYAGAVCAGRLPARQVRAIGRDEEMFETVMLALRTVAGLPLRAFSARFGVSLYEAYPQAVAR